MLAITCNKASSLTMFRASVLMEKPVIFPTDTIYGIGAPISSVSANRKIFDIKQRPLSHTMPILVADYEQLRSIATLEKLTAEAMEWVQSEWSGGGYTAILPAKDTLDSIYKKGDTVAVRILRTGWLADTLLRIGPVTATSVNITGSSSLNDADTILQTFAFVDAYLLWGKAQGNKASKIVDITGGKAIFIRY